MLLNKDSVLTGFLERLQFVVGFNQAISQLLLKSVLNSGSLVS